MSNFLESNDKTLLVHEEVRDYEKKPRRTFQSFVKEKRKMLISKSGKKGISTKELANMVGISEQMFPKVLNMQKPTKKRDCIIAICAMLRLDSEETNEALHLYNNMPCLDTEVPREDLLITILEEQLSKPLSIEEIDKRLENNGFDKLDIIDHRRSIKNTQETKRKEKYKVIRDRTRTFTDDLVYGDQYDSLETEYSPYRYRCIAEMLILNLEDKCIYELSADINGSGSKIPYDRERGQFDYGHFEHYNSPIEAGELEIYFSQLKTIAAGELRRMLGILNDTRNYYERIGARMKNRTMSIFVEGFNYSVPELSEYYLMEKLGSEYCLYVYSKSEFMKYYLTGDEYKKWYAKKSEDVPIATYKSVDDVEFAIRNRKSQNHIVLRHHKGVFNKLKEKIDELNADLKSRKRFIRNLNNIFDDPDRVCDFFNVKDEFQCTLDDEYGDILTARIDEYVFRSPNGKAITVSLDDLYRAFELGFNTISEVCQVKEELGSIEAVLQ